MNSFLYKMLLVVSNNVAKCMVAFRLTENIRFATLVVNANTPVLVPACMHKNNVGSVFIL